MQVTAMLDVMVRNCWACEAPVKVIGRARTSERVYCPSNDECKKARDRWRQLRFVANKKAEGVDVYAKYRPGQYQRRRERVAAGLELPKRQRWPETYKAHDQLRRARKMGLDTEVFTTKEICERDGWTCGICRLPVEPGLRYPNPRSASLDHIVPLSKSGPHTRANCRCSHLECNVARNNRDD